MFTASDVKELRERTGCGMMDCKKALVETNGDMEKAIEFLREKGLAAAAKKSGRIAAEGIVDAYVSEDGKVAVLIEVNSETDFVAKNDDFRQFVQDVAAQVAVTSPKCVKEEGNTSDDCLLNQKFFKDNSKTIGDMLTEKIATIGENMNIRRFERYAGVVETYIHGGGRIGVMVLFDAADSVLSNPGFKEFAKDIAMQIAASNPQFLDSSAVPSEEVEKEKEILKAQALNEGKPANIVDKMVEGRISKFYKEVCLIEQPFIKDQDISVKKFISDKSKEFGTDISVKMFARFEKGEGIEKREDDFASEVANMIK